jgi:MarR family transcriptional repressor of emrRAB
VNLALTDEGVQIVRRDFQAQNERESEWAEALEPDEVATLAGLLEKLMQHRTSFGARARH